jgi:hypothetical protein
MAFELPQLPTDNLYKFMALSGMAIILACLIPVYHLQKLRLDVIRLDGEADRLIAEANWISSDIEKTQKHIDELNRHIAALEGLSTSDILGGSRVIKEKRDEASEVKAELMKLEPKLSELNELKRKQTLTMMNINSRTKEKAYLLSIIRIGFGASTIWFFAGLFLTCKGFHLWYKKLQVPQDKLLQKQAKGENA